MKAKLYFPFEINMINNNKESMLIEALGPKGFGGYIMILTELRHNPNYRCTLSAVKGMARRCKISQKLLEQVLYDFDLFKISREEEEPIISSPYMDQAMSTYEEKHRRLSEAAKKRSSKCSRDENGQFTDTIGALNEIKLNEIKSNKTTTAVAVVENGECSETPHPSSAAVVDDNHVMDANAGLKSWKTYLDIATGDEAWMAILAMNSGISKLFVKHRQAVIEAFRQHIQLQGKGSSLQSVAHVQAYFANFLRPGTPTHKRVAEQLAALEEQTRQASPNRFETIDPETGQRNYYGHPIPADAPLRPNDNAAWSPTEHKWI